MAPIASFEALLLQWTEVEIWLDVFLTIGDDTSPG